MKSILLFSLLSITAFSVQGQVLTGNIIDVFDHSYLQGLKVENMRTAATFTSGHLGYFRLKVEPGDSVVFSKEGYVTHVLMVKDTSHQLVSMIFDAVGLPAVSVYGERPSIYIPGVSLDKDPNRKPMGPGTILPGHSGSLTEMTPGFTIDGPISYFSKREKNKRQYKRALEKAARQAPYLEIIRSDSIKRVLMVRFELSEPELDEWIIGFNTYHREHEFLDMDHETVLGLLYEYLNQHAIRGWQ
ncbi:hypothetical protein ADIS_1521 [Lunatimonas lonarensis]|uniref:TonB-dependent receptor n=1 Tax=Lunatimonas lonarensis TaxID=1232681 RepID=R7ZV72_9BACT|nr:hypothetical protein [Lunatimonas lonarensis]EON77982.1 hypothetical protein ADIS_1521 [Lunatimonas lonarensis]